MATLASWQALAISTLNYMIEKPSIPQTIGSGYGTPEPSIPPEYGVNCSHSLVCAELAPSSRVPASAKGTAGPSTEMSGSTPPSVCVYSLLEGCTQARIQVAHQTVIILQVPGSLVSVV